MSKRSKTLAGSGLSLAEIEPLTKNQLEAFESDKNLILVTHYVLISEVLNYAPSSGEIVISDKNLNLIGTIETSN